MPAPRPQRAVSERWIDELDAARVGGPTRRYLARARITATPADVAWSRDHRRGRASEVVTEALLGWLMSEEELAPPPLPPPGWVAASVALYPLDAPPGSLPAAIAPFAAEGLVDGLIAQQGEVDVRGVVAPGHCFVLVLDDGAVISPNGPAVPPPPLFAKRWCLPG
jgi:hypothetical protein